MLEDLADSRYLMTAYTTSSDSWVNFRRTGQKTSLYEVAAILCGAWNALSEDNDFFAELHVMTERNMTPDLKAALGLSQAGAAGPAAGDSVPARPSPDRMDTQELAAYRDTDKLLARELVVLVQAGMEPAHAVRLVSDLQALMYPQVSPLPNWIDPSDPSSEGRPLQDRVREIATQLCSAERTLKVLDYDVESETRSGRPPHRAWVRHLGTIGRALEATAGAASAVGNIAAAVASFGVATGFALGSVLGGAGVMARSMSGISPR